MSLLRTKLGDIDVFVETDHRRAAPAATPPGRPLASPQLESRSQELTPERVAQLEDAVRVAGRLADHMREEVVTKQGPELARVAVRLNLGFTAEGGIALFAKATGSASLDVTLEWSRPG